jgi:hypothetical protein
MERILQSPRSTAIRPLTQKSDNPFANPFISSNQTPSYMSYGKNTPIQGGFFAGYYNGKPNIVGKRLFIEA